MRRWVVVAVAALGVFVAVGFAVTYFVKLRRAAAEVECQNNLRTIALFAGHHAHPKPGRAGPQLPHEIPAGTIVLPDTPPDGRLSWFVEVLPGFDQRRQDTAPILSAIDRTMPYLADPNQAAARTRLLTVLCPGNPPADDPANPAPTCYVGIAGLGADAAAIAIPPPPAAVPPRAGCFRYDSPTPFDRIADGLSQSLLLGERSADLGPWLRGGPATVRGLDDAPGAAPLVAAGGQFGGNHPFGANWAFADGSARFVTDRVDPKVLYGLATIAGTEADALPGE
jgi:prepilin-type processing-associated H-X9-DG protein